MVRKAAVAGSWYPGSADALAAEVDSLLAAVPEFADRELPMGLVVPHAGLRYSGAVAAHAYARLRAPGPLTVVMVGPSHRGAFPGFAVYPTGAFETPLGRVPIDTTVARALASQPGASSDPSPHELEHSLEMQLPLLQRRVRDLAIVPVLMGHQTRAENRQLATALASLGPTERPLLFLASSDLSHYHSAEAAECLDAQVLDAVRAVDAEALQRRLEAFPGHACGGGPMVAVLSACRARGASRAELLRYGHSGEAGERDRSRVVGYLAAALR